MIRIKDFIFSTSIDGGISCATVRIMDPSIKPEDSQNTWLQLAVQRYGEHRHGVKNETSCAGSKGMGYVG